VCLATPVKIKKISGRSAEVEGGKNIDTSLVQEKLSVGDFLLVHEHLAINKISEDEAQQIIELAKSCHHEKIKS